MLGRRRSRDARLAETKVGPTDFRRNKPTGFISLATGVQTSLKPVIPEPATLPARPPTGAHGARLPARGMEPRTQ